MFDAAAHVARTQGLSQAQAWILDNVPEQLQPVIEKNVRLRIT